MDLSATISTGFTLSALTLAAGELVGELAGTDAPEVLAVVGRRYHRGVEIDPGAAAPPGACIRVGDLGPSGAHRSVDRFDLELRSPPDRARVRVVDHGRRGRGGDGTTMAISPQRTPVGVLLATAAALAAATVGEGEFVDLDLRLVDPPITDPQAFVDRTRLQPTDLPLAAAALAWVRRFEHLGAWPPAP